MSRDAGFFDRWYAEMDSSAVRDQLARRALGLPPDMDVSGLLPWAGVTEVAAALKLAPGQLLVDLGCGRGGYSLEIARQTGARLLGLDFSPVAVATAASRAAAGAGGAAFCVGSATAIGVGTHAADAVVCIDTIMFADPHLDAISEFRRILAAGGRLVITSWAATNLADGRHPRWAHRIDLMRDLTEAGFEQVEIVAKPAWREAERDLWEAAIHTSAAGDPAIEALHEEARRALELFDSTRRILATATAPDL